MNEQTARFGDVEWFRRLGAEMAADRALHERIGEIDLTCVISVLDTADGDLNTKLVFEEFDLVGVERVGPDFEPAAEGVDFVLAGDAADWQEVIEHLAARRGRPDREFTLNYLSLPGTPLRCWSDDPLGRDMFFRFNQSLQHFFNASHRIRSTFPQPL